MYCIVVKWCVFPNSIRRKISVCRLLQYEWFDDTIGSSDYGNRNDENLKKHLSAFELSGVHLNQMGFFFLKIRDLYESYVNPTTLKPSLYKRNIFEGGFTKTEKYIFKPDGRTIMSTSKRKNSPENNSTFSVTNGTHDIVTLIYKLRTVDFQNYKNGQTKSFQLVFDEKEIPVVIKFMGKETISAGNLGTKECYKLSIGARTKVLKGKDQNIIWLTADAKKIPALIKFSIPVGVGQLKLSNASGI